MTEEKPKAGSDPGLFNSSLRAERSNPEATKENWIASSLRSSQ
jgi:hypothetical protein